MNLAAILRHTREAERVSQLDLALRLSVSQRHVSFLETGRSQPSRGLLLAWMNELNAPASIRNAALMQAGFAVGAADGGSVKRSSTDPARAALRQVLEGHEPFAGLVFNIDRFMLDVNKGGRWLWSILMPEYWRAVSRMPLDMDMIDAMVDPRGLLSRMRNAGKVGAMFLALLRAEEWVRPGLKPRVDSLDQALNEQFGDMIAPLGTEPSRPQMDIVFDTDYGPMSFILSQSVFGLPQDITVDSLRVELWFPADQATRDIIRAYAPSTEAAQS
jgi:transcriptional regulator with XRE-family HTH domain